MTKRIGNVIFIEGESPQQCDYCGKIAELRPYGRDRATICHDCAVKPQNKAEAYRQMDQQLFGDEGAAVSRPPESDR
jgi:hypothetical protein